MMLDQDLTANWLSLEEFKHKHLKAPVREHPNSVLRAAREPTLSVIIITYQHAEYIQDAIEGVLKQKTAFPIEVIIGDDDSTDGTREICIAYAKRFPEVIRLFLHSRDNNISVLGKPSGIFQIAYNILSCRGKYLALTSGDDYWQDETKLQKQIEYLERNKTAAFSYHDHLRIFPERRKSKGPYAVERIQTIVGRNVFTKLPDEFLNIIQEDTFLKFFWHHLGFSHYHKTIEPCVIRFHLESMYTSLDSQTTYTHRKNLWLNVIKACNYSRSYERLAVKNYIEAIFYSNRNEPRLSTAQKIRTIFRDLLASGYLIAGCIHIARLTFRKAGSVGYH